MMPVRIARKLTASLIVLAVLFFADSSFSEELLYPLKYAKVLAATFGEYRQGHPHAGVDLSTGLAHRAVIAAAEGDVILIKVSPYGYGRVLYERTQKGQILVYAHMSGFAPKIRKVVNKIQNQNGRYSFSRSFSPGEMPVRRGEVIGFSGDTGTDVPHLHFEIRNAANVTTNPLLNGLEITDTLPPVIQKIHAEPLNYDALVNEGWHDKIFHFKKADDGSYYLEEPIRIGGRVGLSVAVTDYIDGSNRSLNPYFIEMTLRGERIYYIRYDKFSYEQGAVSELDYITRLHETRRGTFHRLFKLYENTIFNPEPVVGNLSGLSPGQYKATITTGDAKGNVSTGFVPLIVNSPPRLDSIKVSPEDQSVNIKVVATDTDGLVTRVSIARQVGKDWEEIPAPSRGKGIYTASIPMPTEPVQLRIFATDDYGAESRPYFTVYSSKATSEPAGKLEARHSFSHRGKVISLLLLRSSGFSNSPDFKVTLDPPMKGPKRTLDNVIYQEPTALRVNTRIPDGWPGGKIIFSGIFKDKAGNIYTGNWALPLQIIKKSGGTVFSSDGSAQMVFPPNCSYTNLPCRIKQMTVRSPSWLERVTDTYDFSQGWQPMRSKARVALTLPDDTPHPEKVGLYLHDRGVWWYLGNERYGRNISARVSHPGAFALMRDVSAPDIKEIIPSGVVTDLKPLVEVSVSDAGSGISAGSIDFRLDGIKKIVEWHPYHGWVRYYPEKVLPVGTHKVQITLTDKAGNSSTQSGSFTISR